MSDLERQLADANAERDLLAQAMWDGWAALGFDTDGDTHPGALIAGAGSYAKFAEWWLRDIRLHRKDDDEGMDEYAALDDELRAARAALNRVAALADEWADCGIGSCSDNLAALYDALTATGVCECGHGARLHESGRCWSVNGCSCTDAAPAPLPTDLCRCGHAAEEHKRYGCSHEWEGGDTQTFCSCHQFDAAPVPACEKCGHAVASPDGCSECPDAAPAEDGGRDAVE